MAQSEMDKFRKVQFRETARDILKTDRWKRKYGQTVDTGGAIARALEKAYQLGRKEEREGQPEIAPQNGLMCMNWYLIPPRPRGAFWAICLHLLGDQKPFHTFDGGLELMSDGYGQNFRWVLLRNWSEDGSIDRTRTWGRKTISPLKKLGLLEEKEEYKLSLTPKGILTWHTALSHVDFDCASLAG